MRDAPRMFVGATSLVVDLTSNDDVQVALAGQRIASILAVLPG